MNFEMRLANRALLDRVVAMVRDEVMPMIATTCCTVVKTPLPNSANTRKAPFDLSGNCVMLANVAVGTLPAPRFVS